MSGAAYQPRAYQLRAYQTGSTGPAPGPFNVGTATVLTNKKSGPSFTRKRFEEFLELERRAQEAERKAQELKQEKERLAAVAAAQEVRRLALEARERQSLDWQDDFDLLRLRHAVDAFNSAHSTVERLRTAHLMALSATAARYQFDDDDEAILLLI